MQIWAEVALGVKENRVLGPKFSNKKWFKQNMGMLAFNIRGVHAESPPTIKQREDRVPFGFKGRVELGYILNK
jgi:hypothetical protein